ncbi:hypothetical protein Cgig2_027240 [Carnegiea gigantea]|uniref:Uncharacterized protein n=1 Tax=Carnegiea gigantea TaxID=171969 RepID=A0A9Q1QB70_9CARY|nr:hypothetical protein Cgig2_027240 [Carnegiea gigantea]
MEMDDTKDASSKPLYSEGESLGKRALYPTRFAGRASTERPPPHNSYPISEQLGPRGTHHLRSMKLHHWLKQIALGNLEAFESNRDTNHRVWHTRKHSFTKKRISFQVGDKGTRTFEVNFLVVDAPMAYNVTFAPYLLLMRFELDNGVLRVTQGRVRANTREKGNARVKMVPQRPKGSKRSRKSEDSRAQDRQ